MSRNIRIHRALSLIGGGTPVRILIDGRSFGTIMTGGTADYPVSEGAHVLRLEYGGPFSGMAKLEPLTLFIPAGREDLSYEMHVRPAGAGWKITLDPVGAPAGNRSPVQPRPSNELDLFRPNGPRYRPLRKDPNMTRRELEEVIVGGMLASFVIPCLDENGEYFKEFRARTGLDIRSMSVRVSIVEGMCTYELTAYSHRP